MVLHLFFFNYFTGYSIEITQVFAGTLTKIRRIFQWKKKLEKNQSSKVRNFVLI